MTKNLKRFWLLHGFDKPGRLNEQWRKFVLFQLLSGLDALENAIDAAQSNVTEIAGEVPLVQKQFAKNIEQLNITKKNALDAHDQSQTARKVRKGHYLSSIFVYDVSLWSVLVFASIFFSIFFWLWLEWILQNMVRHFLTHKQVQADKRE